ncbi:hypothetical protein [Ferrimonas marina]|uniref:Uncharacterized protein n=1 Tax=Ferrimonas marina TaxID=299255 RepID=A0A1M5TZR2_9GAMM|nr:hypothetical protein [Ferrimonas marina]SHH56106.1 hypothetical protein SAMN02745129_2341 [Ferrimonas marina]
MQDAQHTRAIDDEKLVGSYITPYAIPLLCFCTVLPLVQTWLQPTILDSSVASVTLLIGIALASSLFSDFINFRGVVNSIKARVIQGAWTFSLTLIVISPLLDVSLLMGFSGPVFAYLTGQLMVGHLHNKRRFQQVLQQLHSQSEDNANATAKAHSGDTAK